MISAPHLRPFWVNFLMCLNERVVDESAISEEIRRFLIAQTQDTCRKTLDRFDKWRDGGCDSDA